MNYKNIYTMFFTVLIMGTFFVGCKKENTYSPPPPSKVTVNKPRQQNITNYLEFTGITEAMDSVEIRPRVEGYLEKVMFKPGSFVKKGDLLFVIDQRPYKAKLGEAKAQLAIEISKLKAAEATFQRMEMAYKERAVSEVSVIQARADMEVAKAAIESANAAVQTAELNLSYTTIHAPISGRIDRSLVDAGNLIGAGENTLLATIINDNSIYVYFNVNERDIIDSDLINGEADSFKVYLGLLNKEFSHKGKIDYINNRVNPATGNVQVRGVFENSKNDILPGMFANIKISEKTIENALLVPDNVVGRDQQGYYLLAVNNENIVVYKHVEIGDLIDGMRVIKSGIEPNERIIVNGIQMAYPGREVSPIDEENSENRSPKTENQSI
ncbi:efflux RND transporter periplasmic adaptor subunit [uncultured Ilyobacter sp.]|uniref:efflux RND transporter periplasmic adaptor subunit n=1 Tax=uncultured Ilyobacter sp. TaxID=544433 RepID=UPI0029C7609B|nr:efflux RND transporter periplasmic adaptor subunit [uncultured Ilyobacter sp.]